MTLRQLLGRLINGPRSLFANYFNATVQPTLGIYAVCSYMSNCISSRMSLDLDFFRCRGFQNGSAKASNKNLCCGTLMLYTPCCRICLQQIVFLHIQSVDPRVMLDMHMKSDLAPYPNSSLYEVLSLQNVAIAAAFSRITLITSKREYTIRSSPAVALAEKSMSTCALESQGTNRSSILHTCCWRQQVSLMSVISV